MRKLDISSHSFMTYKFLFKNFASYGRLQSVETLHGHVIKSGLVSTLCVTNSLLDLYAKHGGSLGIIRTLLDDMPTRDGVSWNTVITAHMSRGEVDHAITLLDSVPERHVAPWNSVVRGLFDSDIVSKVELAYRVFKRMPRKNMVSWNAMIKCLVGYHMYFSLAFSTFNDILARGGPRCKPDETTLLAMLSACTQFLYAEQGKWLASCVEENNFSLSLPLGNALVEMFVTYKDVRNASIIFEKMPERCLNTWRTMIHGLSANGFGEEALDLFETMCSEGLKPDGAIFSEVLGVFTYDECMFGDGKRLFGLLHRMVHDYGIKPSTHDYRMMADIVCAAGWIEEAVMLTENMSWEPCPFSWGRILSACKIHGYEDLLESSLIKISKSHCDYRQLYYLRIMLSAVISSFLREKRDDSIDLKLTMESLVEKMCNQDFNDPKGKKRTELSTLINVRINGMQNTLKLEQQRPDRCSILQARESFPPEEIHRALESLQRQVALHGRNDHCQVDGFVDV